MAIAEARVQALMTAEDLLALPAETGFRLARNPDTVRAADLAYVSAERLPATLPKDCLGLAPDLVAKVVSPRDDPDGIQAKVRDWLEAGARLVLVVCPGPRQVAAYRSLREFTVLTEADTLTAPGIPPEFSLELSALFAQANL
jgi:Uma2 family endonuclease